MQSTVLLYILVCLFCLKIHTQIYIVHATLKDLAKRNTMIIAALLQMWFIPAIVVHTQLTHAMVVGYSSLLSY